MRLRVAHVCTYMCTGPPAHIVCTCNTCTCACVWRMCARVCAQVLRLVLCVHVARAPVPACACVWRMCACSSTWHRSSGSYVLIAAGASGAAIVQASLPFEGIPHTCTCTYTCTYTCTCTCTCTCTRHMHMHTAHAHAHAHVHGTRHTAHGTCTCTILQASLTLKGIPQGQAQGQGWG